MAIGQMCNLRVLELRFEIQEGQQWVRECSMWRFLARGLRSCCALASVKLLQGGFNRWQDICLPCLHGRAIREFASEGLRLDETCVRVIASWRHLRSLDLGMVSLSGGCPLSLALESAGASRQLEVLAFGQYCWRDDRTIWPDVIGCLSGCLALRRVVLRYADSVTSRVPFCQLPSFLREVVLQGLCYAGYVSETPVNPTDGARWIGWLIADMTQLEVLDFSMYMSPACFRIVAACIPTRALRTLSLCCILGQNIVCALCDLLDRSPGLVTLNIRGCERVAGCPLFVSVLSRTLTLVEVGFGAAAYHDSYVPLMLQFGFMRSCLDPVVFRRRR